MFHGSVDNGFILLWISVSDDILSILMAFSEKYWDVLSFRELQKKMGRFLAFLTAASLAYIFAMTNTSTIF